MCVWVFDYNFISSHFKTTHCRLGCYAQWLLCTLSGGFVLNDCSASMIDQPLQKNESVGHGKHPYFLQVFNSMKWAFSTQSPFLKVHVRER